MQLDSTYLTRWRIRRLHIGVAALVLALHAGFFYALWRARATLPAPEPVLVEWIDNRPAPVAEAASSAAPAPQARHSKHARTTVTQRVPQGLPQAPEEAALPLSVPAPVDEPSPEPVVYAANQAPSGASQADAAPQTQVAPARVASDVALACPVRTAPVYPVSARKLGETGRVTMRLELDESGRLVASEVTQSSGFARLDHAAKAAVKTWRCQPAMRDGQALRIVSIESFDFRLDGSKTTP